MSRSNDNGFSAWGGYMEAKISKLEDQFSAASDPFRQSNLFAGISIYVNGLTNPSADELKRIMMVHGGVYHHYERSHTTYIIASNLPDVKIRNMNTSKIISPQWVEDCVKENRILDYKKYLLYTNQKPSQPKISFTKKQETVVLESTVEDIAPKCRSSVEETEVRDIVRDLEILNEKMRSKKPESEESMGEDDCIKTNQESTKTAMQSLNPPSSSKLARTAVDPRFLSEFYNNSRLHHIATLGAGFKQYISDLRENHSGKFPLRAKILESVQKTSFRDSQIIMHIDMDCFFVSVGLRDRPQLQGRPVAVTHSKGGSEPTSRPGVDRQKEMDMHLKRLDQKLKQNILGDKADKIRGFEGKDSLSEIASCSYEARKKGVKNGMFVGQALKLCPELVTMPYDFDGYREVAFTLYDTVAQYTLNIEAVSCDEMFVDLTDVLKEIQVEPMQFVGVLRREVRNKTGCPCSAGVGANRLQARMATKKAKPDGQFYLSSDIVESYMANIPIKDLPGVGFSTSQLLEQNNWSTCEDLQLETLAKLQGVFGKKMGENLHRFCRGQDTRPLVYDQVRKSVSAEVNYGIRFKDTTEMETFLRQLCTEVHSRLLDVKRRGKCITLKVMVRAKDAPVETSKFMGHGVCDHFSKSISLLDFTSDLETITKTVLTLMSSVNAPPHELRGLGIQISKLDGQTEEKKENVLKNMFEKVKQMQKGNPEKSKKDPESNSVIVLREEKGERKNLLKSPKKRTSPRKKAGVNKGAQKTTKMPNIADMLQNAPARKRSQFEYEFEDIDMNILAELPEEIRQEILKSKPKMPETNLAQTGSKKPKLDETRLQGSKVSPVKINVDSQFLDALPADIRQEIEKQIEDQKKGCAIEQEACSSKKGSNIATPASTESEKSENNFLLREDWRQLLQAWVESTNDPELYDVNLISQNATELILTNRSFDLYVPMKFLCRIINEKRECRWHEAYTTILSSVQVAMVNFYGAEMYLPVKLDCVYCSGNLNTSL